MTTTIGRRPITDALEAHLEALPHPGAMQQVTVYRGRVFDPATGDTDPPTLAGDPFNVVAPYVVIYPFAGVRGLEAPVSDDAEDIDYGVQLTCVAGYPTDCEALVDRVDAWVYHWSPTVSGVVCGRFEPPPGYDSGPVQHDNTISPPRFYVPLNYRLTATR